MKSYLKIKKDNKALLETSITEKRYSNSCKEKENALKCLTCDLTNEDDICFKKILESEKENVKNRYDLYSRGLEKIEVSKKKKEALISLYKPATTTVRKMLSEIKKITTNNYCPYCGLTMGNTIEHILPKDDYPEFSIYSDNLIPCCSECNTNKGVSIKNDDNGEYSVYNFYEDEVPKEEFLEVNFTLCEGGIKAKYSVKENANILFKNHINQLKLLKRYELNTPVVITEIKNSVRNSKGNVVIEDLKKIYREKYRPNLVTHGYNYWKGILELAISDSKLALDEIFGPYRNIEKIEYKYEKNEFIKEIRLDVVAEKIGFKTYSYNKEKIPILNKGYELMIIANEHREYDEILWQVRNYGEEALNEDKLRGQIFKSYLGCKLKEDIKYNGEHEVICYGIKNNKCIGTGKIKVRVDSDNF